MIKVNPIETFKNVTITCKNEDFRYFVNGKELPIEEFYKQFQ